MRPCPEKGSRTNVPTDGKQSACGVRRDNAAASVVRTREIRMGLQRYAFLTAYRSGHDRLIRDFYRPFWIERTPTS